MNKSILTLFLTATMMAMVPAYADGFDFIGGNTQAEKPAKAPREKNDGRGLETMAKSFGTGVGVGAVGVAALGTAALPVLAPVGGIIIGEYFRKNSAANTNAFYSGTVVRGKIDRFVRYRPRFFSEGLGIDGSVPTQEMLDNQLIVAILDVDGPSDAYVFAFIPTGKVLGKGDIVDVKSPVGVFTYNSKVSDNLHFDFNKHAPRVVNIYCKHDNPTCQNDYDSSLGVLYRHTDTEFPPSQYLIDPAIIAADQARMRREEADKKAAQNSGGFNFM